MRKLFLLVLAGLLLPASAFAQVNPSRPLKVALLLPGTITDGTFCSAADKGMKAAEKKFPNIKVTMQENISFAQSEESMRAYARDGYDVVIGHGFQFAEPAAKLYKEFPKVQFIVNTAKWPARPISRRSTIVGATRAITAGYIAAMVTKTGIIGHAGGIPVPVIQEYNEGFERGAKRFNPERQDAVRLRRLVQRHRQRQGSDAQPDRAGADVVTATGNESVIGTLEAAKEKKVLMIGTAFDSASFAPDTIVTTALVNFDVNLEMAISKILDGTIEPKNYLLGLNENGIGLAGYGKFDNAISPENKAKVQALLADIKAGKVTDLPAIR